MPIGENIKRLREQYGLNQAELGRIAGVSDKAVSTWEKGIKAPRMGALEKIADYFGIKKSELIDDIDTQTFDAKMRDADILEAMHQNPKLGILFDRQRNMSDKDIEMMLALSERISKEEYGD